MNNLLREYVREALIYEERKSFLLRAHRQIPAQVLVGQLYNPILLEECMRECRSLLLEDAPPAVRDMTVQELLDKIESLEKTMEDRKEMIDALEKKEKLALKMEVLIKKTLKKSAGDLKGLEQKDRLEKLQGDLEEFINKVKEVRTKLGDPDISAVGVVAEDVKTVLKLFKTVVMQNAKSLASDLQLGDWKDIFDSAAAVLDVVEKLPFMKVFLGGAKEVVEWLGRGAKGLSWLGKQIGIGGEKPAKALDKLVDKVAQAPDTKTAKAPFMKLFNIDDEYQAMIDDKLEVTFIQDFKERLKKFPWKDMKVGDLDQLDDTKWDIDTALEDWIPDQPKTQGKTVSQA